MLFFHWLDYWTYCMQVHDSTDTLIVYLKVYKHYFWPDRASVRHAMELHIVWSSRKESYL